MNNNLILDDKNEERLADTIYIHEENDMFSINVDYKKVGDLFETYNAKSVADELARKGMEKYSEKAEVDFPLTQNTVSNEILVHYALELLIPEGTSLYTHVEKADIHPKDKHPQDLGEWIEYLAFGYWLPQNREMEYERESESESD